MYMPGSTSSKVGSNPVLIWVLTVTVASMG